MATIKQRKAIANAVENGGNITKAMRDAGYAETTVNNPVNLTKTTAWQDLMEAYLPDDTLLRALADDIEGKPLNRKAELELGFKLKGKMIEKSESNVVVEVSSMTNEEKTALLSLLNDKASSS